jgi:hypothetical protein
MSLDLYLGQEPGNNLGHENLDGEKTFTEGLRRRCAIASGELAANGSVNIEQTLIGELQELATQRPPSCQASYWLIALGYPSER